MSDPIIVSESVKRYDFDGDKKADTFTVTVTRYEDASTEDGYRDEVSYSADMTKRGHVDEAGLRRDFCMKDGTYGGVTFEADVAFSRKPGRREKFDGVKEHIEASPFSYDSNENIYASINDTAYVDPQTKGGKRLLKVFEKSPDGEHFATNHLKHDVVINKHNRAAVSHHPSEFEGKIYVDFIAYWP